MELDIDDIDAAGLDREKVDALVTRARREVDEGRLPSCQLAVARNGVIGVDNGLPWRLAADLRRFRSLTTGHTIVMGRKTWESLPGALPGRENVVVTRQLGYRADNAVVVASLEDALAAASLPAPVFCIGGGELYGAALPRADILYLTEIDRDVPGDTTFPAFDRARWREIYRESHSRDTEDGFGYAFVTYRRAH